MTMKRFALATVGLVSMVTAGMAVTALPTGNYSADQDGSSRYYALFGLWGIGGDSQVDATNHQLNTIGAQNVTPTDCSGTITTGGTAQNAITAQTTLHGFTIQNIDTTEPLWISFTTTAAASGSGSYALQAATATTFASAGSYTTPPGFGSNHAVSVIAATTSHKFTCSWW